MTHDTAPTLDSTLSAVSPAWAEAIDASALAADAFEVADAPLQLCTGASAIHLGWRMHRDGTGLLRGASPDLALLVGDWCYAYGLERVAEHGTLDDVETLAELVADVSARADEDDDTLCPTWVEAVAALAR